MLVYDSRVFRCVVYMHLLSVCENEEFHVSKNIVFLYSYMNGGFNLNLDVYTYMYIHERFRTSYNNITFFNAHDGFARLTIAFKID